MYNNNNTSSNSKNINKFYHLNTKLKEESLELEINKNIKKNRKLLQLYGTDQVVIGSESKISQ